MNRDKEDEEDTRKEDKKAFPDRLRGRWLE